MVSEDNNISENQNDSSEVQTKSKRILKASPSFNKLSCSVRPWVGKILADKFANGEPVEFSPEDAEKILKFKWGVEVK